MKRAASLVVLAGFVALGKATLVGQGQDLEVLQIRPNFYMIAGAGGNVGVQVGDDGVVVVDAGSSAQADAVLAAIRRITPQPIRYVINTSADPDHVGGNEKMSQAGQTLFTGRTIGLPTEFAGTAASVLATENVLTRMSGATPEYPTAALPTETFFYPRKYMFLNGEGIEVLHQPAAHTDGDSLVFFRRSDVVATGDLFTTVMYPFIDTANGGTMNGYVKALNAILDITVASNVNEGGTMVVPGHGRLSDEQDVIEYRDMATIVRDRIREYVKRGMTLEQVKAKKPTLDFDPRYGSDTGFWTTSMFVETIYKEMVKENPPAPAKGNQRNRGTQSKGSGA